MVPVRECYEVADGRFYVEGSRLVDNDMVVERMSLMVLESSSPTYPVGTPPAAAPAPAPAPAEVKAVHFFKRKGAPPTKAPGTPPAAAPAPAKH